MSTGKPAMSWADRARGGSITSSKPAQMPSVAVAAIAKSASGVEQPMVRNASTRSSSSSSSIGQTTADSIGTTQPGTESEVGPSTATSSLPDTSDLNDAKTETNSMPSVPQPAPVPSVNVWAVRKEQMLQKHAAASRPAQAQAEPLFPSSGSNLVPTEIPAQKPRTSTTQTQPSSSGHSSKSNPAFSNTSSTSSVPISHVNAASSSRTSPLAADIEAWPSLEEEQTLPLPETPRKSRTSSNETDVSRTAEKKKGKWVALPVDITIKSSHPPRRNQSTSAERKRETSTDSQNLRRQPAQKELPITSKEASINKNASKSKQRDISNFSTPASAAIPNPSTDLPQPHLQTSGLVAPEIPSSLVRTSPDFHYRQSTQDVQASHMNGFPPGPPSNSDSTLAPGDELAIANSVHAEPFEPSQYDSAYRFQNSFRPVGRGGRGLRPGFETSPRGSSRGSGRVGRGASSMTRPFETSRATMNGSPTFSPSSSMHGYPPAPMYPATDYNYSQSPYTAYNPYISSYMPYGYSGAPYNPYVPDPNIAAQSYQQSQRPIPNNPHLLDPAMDEISFYILGQIEYYLGEDNLAKDPFLREKMDSEGWVSIPMLASFNRVKQLSTDLDLIKSAIYRSTWLEIAPDHVRRRGDFRKWILPTAQVSRVNPAEVYSAPILSNGVYGMSPAMENLSVSYSPVEVKVSTTVPPTGKSPYSQPTLIIGGELPHHGTRPSSAR